MKICQVAAVDFTLYHFIAPLCRALTEAGHEVVAVSDDGPLIAPLRAKGLRVETVPFSRRLGANHLIAYRRLVALFRAENFDMVHAHTPVAAFIARFAARAAGVPRIVYTAHGFYFHERMAPLPKATVIVLEWLAGRVTDVLLTQAEEDAAVARRLRLCRGGVIAAIGNGVDPARFAPAADGETRRRLRAALATPANAVVVMIVARLVAEKGYSTLLRAMRDLDAHLWVVGERLPSDHAGSIDAALAAATTALGPRLRLLGRRADVADLLRAADVFTLPSRREGMPRSIIEAMMTGLPVVASDIRGSREEVVDGQTGYLVPVDDAPALARALARLIADADLRHRMGAAGLKRARALYDEGVVIRRQLEILDLAPPG